MDYFLWYFENLPPSFKGMFVGIGILLVMTAIMFFVELYLVKWLCEKKGYASGKFIVLTAFIGLPAILTICFAPDKNNNSDNRNDIKTEIKEVETYKNETHKDQMYKNETFKSIVSLTPTSENNFSYTCINCNRSMRKELPFCPYCGASQKKEG